MSSFAQILVGGVMQGAIFALVTLGFSLVHRVTGVVNLAQGAFCVVGALVAYTLQVQWGLPAAVAVIGAVLAVTGGGAALGAVTFVPGLQRLSNSNMVMLTAGLLTLLEGLVLLVWGSQPYALPAFNGERPLAVAGVLVPSQGPWVAGADAVHHLGRAEGRERSGGQQRRADAVWLRSMTNRSILDRLP